MFVGLLGSSDNSVDHDAMFSVEDVEQDPPVADTNPMQIPFKLLDAKGTWVLPQRSDGLIKPMEDITRGTLKFPLGARRQGDFVRHSNYLPDARRCARYCSYGMARSGCFRYSARR